MFTSEVDIYNAALNAVGTRSTVALPTEKSREAEVCRRWFGPVRDQVLRAAPWSSAKAFQRLALITENDFQDQWVNTDPEPGFTFVYGLPNDLIRPRYLVGFQRFTTSTYPNGQLAINTNIEQAVLCYTKRQETIGLWDSSLQMAVVYALASYICMPIHGKAQRARATIEQANALIMQAREETTNSDEANVATIPDWISARGFATPIEDTRFIYPSGPLFSFGELGV